MICRGGKVWVPEAMVPEILTMYHDDRGHFGVNITVQMIQEKFWIPKITGAVSEYIRKCDTCWRMKEDTRAPQGFQLNIEVPKEPMEVLHIDFTEVNGKFVMTVVDRFRKRGWFVLLTATDARSVAVAFFNRIVTYWGLPRAIISDRDAKFTGKF